jgi:predicted Fe-Mo cluster-binding NifX family protein
MKIAVSAHGADVNAAVDERFGRCRQFVLVDVDTMQTETIDNAGMTTSGGAGIQTAQALASQGVQIVLTGNCGPNAFKTLQAAGIQVYLGASGTVQQAIEQHQQGRLQLADQPNVSGHHHA